MATVDSSWLKKYNDALASIDSKADRCRWALSTYRDWIYRYKGGLPVGFFTAIAQQESDWKMSSAGDPELGEVGFYQITASAESTFGLPTGFRAQPENNIFMAGLEYNVEAKRLTLKFPGLVADGTRDQWMLARLVFSVGRAGTYKLINNARARGLVFPFNVYNGLIAYVDATGGIELGSQSPGKVWWRTKAVPIVWEVGNRAATSQAGPPVRIPSPNNIPYRVPSDVADYLKTDTAAMLLAAVAAGVAIVMPG